MSAGNIHVLKSRKVEGACIHTCLTSLKAIRLSRQIYFDYLTVHIKTMPTGEVQRFVVNGSDSVINLYNNFNAHSRLACTAPARGFKLIMPLSTGLFELSNEKTLGDEMNIATKSGDDLLSRYGLITKGSSIVLLCFTRYHLMSAPKMLSALLEKSSKVIVVPSSSWRVFNDLGKIPDHVCRDIVQTALLELIAVKK